MSSSSQSIHDATPLYVDLDETFVQTDTLWECVIEVSKTKPWLIPLFPIWALGGPVRLKSELIRVVELPYSTLPVNPDVRDLIEARRAAGGRVVLATAAHRKIAEGVADCAGCFDGVLATENGVNLKSSRKLERIRKDCGNGPFDYAGDSRADLSIWSEARQAFFAGGNEGIYRSLEAAKPSNVYRLGASASGPKSFLKLLRVHQWAKNLLIFVPLLVSHLMTNLDAVISTFLAFAAFSVLASSIYILNDLCDLPADRVHPKKKFRPIASGAIKIPVAIVTMVLTLATTAALTIGFLGKTFGLVLGGYLLANIAYSTVLKRKIVLDIVVLSLLYTLRIIAGAAAISVVPSDWLLAFSMFFFTSLAMAKRYTELSTISVFQDGKFRSGRRYLNKDVEIFRSAGPSFGVGSVLIFALYIRSENVLALYNQPHLLWALAIILLYWIMRIWFLAGRGRVDHDPVLFAIKDQASIVCGIVAAIVILAARFL